MLLLDYLWPHPTRVAECTLPWPVSMETPPTHSFWCPQQWMWGRWASVPRQRLWVNWYGQLERAVAVGAAGKWNVTPCVWARQAEGPTRSHIKSLGGPDLARGSYFALPCSWGTTITTNPGCGYWVPQTTPAQCLLTAANRWAHFSWCWCCHHSPNSALICHRSRLYTLSVCAFPWAKIINLAWMHVIVTIIIVITIIIVTWTSIMKIMGYNITLNTPVADGDPQIALPINSVLQLPLSFLAQKQYYFHCSVLQSSLYVHDWHSQLITSAIYHASATVGPNICPSLWGQEWFVNAG